MGVDEDTTADTAALRRPAPAEVPGRGGGQRATCLQCCDLLQSREDETRENPSKECGENPSIRPSACLLPRRSELGSQKPTLRTGAFSLIADKVSLLYLIIVREKTRPSSPEIVS